MKTDFSSFFQILPEGETPGRLVARTAQLLEYYAKGHQHYVKNISADDRFDHSDTYLFLNRLHQLTQELLDTSGDVSLILSMGENKINLRKLPAFFEEYRPKECLELINVVHTALVEYIHSDNCTDFKLAFQTLSHWRYFFTEIAQNE